jgi:hypothetical protein
MQVLCDPSRDMSLIETGEFLDINLTKDSCLLLNAIHSRSAGGFLKKTRLYSGFKNANKKICETRKLELFVNSNL